MKLRSGSLSYPLAGVGVVSEAQVKCHEGVKAPRQAPPEYEHVQGGVTCFLSGVPLIFSTPEHARGSSGGYRADGLPDGQHPTGLFVEG